MFGFEELKGTTRASKGVDAVHEDSWWRSVLMMRALRESLELPRLRSSL